MYMVLGPFILIVAVISLINVIQNHRSHWLPHFLRDWSFLPLWMRSFQPLDNLFAQLSCCSKCINPPLENLQPDFNDLKDIEAALSAEEMETFVNGKKPTMC